jgi:hypothetical protein
VNPTEVSLQWTASTDDDPIVYYQLYVNGSPDVDTRTNRFAVVHGLTPETTYEITVKARDFYGQNVSAPSNVVTVTTTAVSAVDTEPPSAPGNLNGYDIDGAGEINLFWIRSFDNQTAQASIVYEVYQNGVLDHTLSGLDQTILYANQAGENLFTVIAVDAAGNRSEPANITIVSQYNDLGGDGDPGQRGLLKPNDIPSRSGKGCFLNSCLLLRRRRNRPAENNRGHLGAKTVQAGIRLLELAHLPLDDVELRKNAEDIPVLGGPGARQARPAGGRDGQNVIV